MRGFLGAALLCQPDLAQAAHGGGGRVPTAPADFHAADFTAVDFTAGMELLPVGLG